MRMLKTLSAWFEAWFVWLPVTGVAWTVSLVLALVATGGMGTKLPQALSLALAGMTGGALLGLAQWLMLNPKVKGVGLWTLATAVGWAAGLAAAALAVTAFDPIWVRLAAGILGGLVLGGIQWLALRPEARRVEWVLMTVSGWTVAAALSLILSNLDWGVLRDAILNTATSGAVGLMLIGILAVFGRVILFPDPSQKDATGYVRWWQ